jgi:hypothetical protein
MHDFGNSPALLSWLRLKALPSLGVPQRLRRRGHRLGRLPRRWCALLVQSISQGPKNQPKPGAKTRPSYLAMMRTMLAKNREITTRLKIKACSLLTIFFEVSLGCRSSPKVQRTFDCQSKAGFRCTLDRSPKAADNRRNRVPKLYR